MHYTMIVPLYWSLTVPDFGNLYSNTSFFENLYIYIVDLDQLNIHIS